MDSGSSLPCVTVRVIGWLVTRGCDLRICDLVSFLLLLYTWTRTGTIHDSNSRLRLKMNFFDESQNTKSKWFWTAFMQPCTNFMHENMWGCGEKINRIKLNQWFAEIRNESCAELGIVPALTCTNNNLEQPAAALSPFQSLAAYEILS